MSGEKLTAVFTNSAGGPLAVFVNGRSQQVAQATSGSEATVPAAPYVMGYTFAGWLKDGVAQELGSTVTVSENVEYVAAYARSAEKYAVTVNGGTGSGEYRYNDVVTAVADAPAAGQKFGYWTKDGAVVSYDAAYKFYATGAATVEAVYVGESETVERKPVLVASVGAELVGESGDKLAFFAERDLPEEWEIVETGLLLGQSKDALELGAEGVAKAAARSTEAKGQYTVRKAGVAAGDVWYGRAYVVYREAGEMKTMYSEVVGNE